MIHNGSANYIAKPSVIAGSRIKDLLRQKINIVTSPVGLGPLAEFLICKPFQRGNVIFVCSGVHADTAQGAMLALDFSTRALLDPIFSSQRGFNLLIIDGVCRIYISNISLS